jgi:hypothetical protein
VLIPDVQKLINQLGAVNTDLFASRHVRPPTSVLLLPLRASGAGIYGALYCLSDVQVGWPGGGDSAPLIPRPRTRRALLSHAAAPLAGRQPSATSPACGAHGSASPRPGRLVPAAALAWIALAVIHADCAFAVIRADRVLGSFRVPEGGG